MVNSLRCLERTLAKCVAAQAAASGWDSTAYLVLAQY